MDKFGIFKLLNSFSDFCAENGTDAKKLLDGFLSAKNNVSALRSNADANARNDNSSQRKKSVLSASAEVPQPLQSTMIDVMTSHDELLKRVKKATVPQQPPLSPSTSTAPCAPTSPTE